MVEHVKKYICIYICICNFYTSYTISSNMTYAVHVSTYLPQQQAIQIVVTSLSVLVLRSTLECYLLFSVSHLITTAPLFFTSQSSSLSSSPSSSSFSPPSPSFLSLPPLFEFCSSNALHQTFSRAGGFIIAPFGMTRPGRGVSFRDDPVDAANDAEPLILGDNERGEDTGSYFPPWRNNLLRLDPDKNLPVYNTIYQYVF